MRWYRLIDNSNTVITIDKASTQGLHEVLSDPDTSGDDLDGIPIVNVREQVLIELLIRENGWRDNC